jgi:hypothetical protein
VTEFLKTVAEAPETVAKALEATVTLLLLIVKGFAHERELNYISSKKKWTIFKILSI